MRIKYECNSGVMKIRFLPDSSDTISFDIHRNSYKKLGKVSLGMRECNIHLPEDWTLASVHPDLLALATLSIIFPYIGQEIVLPIGVSRDFYDKFKLITGKEVLPIDPQLSPRKAREHAVPALSYSGGVDSTAAVILLPDQTHLFYIDRITPPPFQKQKTILNQEAAYHACDSMKNHGRSVHMIKTDLQYVRSPVGFASYLSDAVPAVLLADYYGFDSLVNGHTLEEGYQVGYNGYQDAKDLVLIKLWGELLKVVDMPLSLPTIGLSEVSTTKIVINSPYYEFAQACSRGQINKPCMNCYKCFRKNLLEMVIRQVPIPDDHLNTLFKIKDAQKVLSVTPVHFENVITYITSKYNGDHEIMNLLKKKTRGDIVDTSWMEKWYSPSFENTAPKYKEQIKNEIISRINEMNLQDHENMKMFTYNHLRNSSEFLLYEKNFQHLLSKL
ncbi:DUF6395 domain-containing protein [Bacillus salipaludis]|uniref:DUF6395 domain-containing protein n=1 Tax=Bacillus salipaludis TaxID=2547811 RepID=UPI003D1F532A